MADNTDTITKGAAASVEFEDVKTNGGVTAFYTAQQMNDSVSHQRAMNVKREAQMDIGTAVASKAAEMIMNMSVAEGATNAILTGFLSKFFQQTPPPTNIPTQGQ